MPILQKLTQPIARQIFVEKVNGKEYQSNGIEPIKLEERSYRYQQLGGLEKPYQPKFKENEVKTLSTKDQGRRNTCSWNAYTVVREPQEGKVLSVRSIVTYARLKALLSGDGYSTLSNNNKGGSDFGVAEESLLPDNPNLGWEEYSNPKLLTPEVVANANSHRADYRKTFYVKTIDEMIKAIDDGYLIEFGTDWRSSYNMSGGFSYPWILPWGKGTSVGGHAWVGKKYQDLIWSGNKVVDGLLKAQNSYSTGWGERGDFYVKFSDLIKAGVVGMVAVDLSDTQFADFVKSFEGKYVGHAYSKAIWKIEDGFKRAFPNPLVFKAFGGKTGLARNWTLVSRTLLDQVPDSADMDVAESPLWPVISDQWDVIQTLQDPQNFKYLEQKIKENQETIDLYNRKNGNMTKQTSLWDVVKSLFSKNQVGYGPKQALLDTFPTLGSSIDPQKLSLTIRGGLIAATPIIIGLAGLAKIDLGQAEWENFVEQLWQLSNQVILAVGTAMTIWGAIRRAYLAWRSKSQQ